MPGKKKYEVFISYSRDDASEIAPIIAVIKAMKKDLVFQDYQNLEFGKPWEPALLEALKLSKVIVVFWCRHSAASRYVKKEFELAIEQKKDILPIMLDDTPLPKKLKGYQGISFVDFIMHTVRQRYQQQQQQQHREPERIQHHNHPGDPEIMGASIVEALEKLHYIG